MTYHFSYVTLNIVSGRSWDGTRLTALRGKRPQTDLASALRKRGFGTTQTTVSRWESGQEPRASVLPSLAAELGVKLDELYGGDEDEESRAVGHSPAVLALLGALRAVVREEVEAVV